MKTYKLLLLLAALLLFSVNAYSSYRCIMPGTPTIELKKATAVFSGKVIAQEYQKVINASDKDSGAERLFVKLKADRWWKGSGDSEVILRTSIIRFPNGITEMMAEDFYFDTNENYLVYANYYKGSLATSACKRTKKLFKATDELKELGEGFLPVSATIVNLLESSKNFPFWNNK